MTEKPPRLTLERPPGRFLGPAAPSPRATALLPEVRSDSALVLHEPSHMVGNAVTGSSHLARILWRFQLDWREAQEIQLWLAGAPSAGGAPTREAAFRDFIEESMLVGDPPRTFLNFLGIFLTEGVAHAQYTVLLGIHAAVSWTDYQKAWWKAVDRLDANDGWRDEIVWFLRKTVGRATGSVELLMHASAVGDLSAIGPDGEPRYPLNRILVD